MIDISIHSSMCKCKSPGQHLVFRARWHYPQLTLKEISETLHLDYRNAKVLWYKVRHRPDFTRLCPECFQPHFFNWVCHLCGFEPARQDVPLIVDFESQSPVYRIQPHNGLGSDVDYEKLKLSYGGNNIRHLVERDDTVLETLKSQLWEELKSEMPNDYVTEVAAIVLEQELSEVRRRYPLLIKSKHMKRQILENTVARLKMLYPDRVNGLTILPARAEPNEKKVMQ